MREIKFRGLRLNGSGYWEYGSLYINDEKEYFIDKSKWSREPVRPETVGQYTGLKDKNGKEIYEGDIVVNGKGIYLKIYWNRNCHQWWQTTCNKHNVESMGYKWDENNRTDLPIIYNILEVIGNIYENAELLKDNSLK